MHKNMDLKRAERIRRIATRFGNDTTDRLQG